MLQILSQINVQIENKIIFWNHFQVMVLRLNTASPLAIVSMVFNNHACFKFKMTVWENWRNDILQWSSCYYFTFCPFFLLFTAFSLFCSAENSIVEWLCNRTVRALLLMNEVECGSLVLSPWRVRVQCPHSCSQSFSLAGKANINSFRSSSYCNKNSNLQSGM